MYGEPVWNENSEIVDEVPIVVVMIVYASRIGMSELCGRCGNSLWERARLDSSEFFCACKRLIITKNTWWVYAFED